MARFSAPSFPLPGRARLVRWAVSGAVAAVLLTLIGLGARGWALSDARKTATRMAREADRTHAGLLASELQKYRLLPLVLTEYPDVHAAVAADSGAAARLNPKLELLAARTGAAVIYVLDGKGRTVSASNWRLPTSFVGHDYGFRSYFRDALRQGQAEQFALGAVSQRPGLFLARRISGGAGVIAVKVEFDALENDWRRQPGPTLVTDAEGIVVLTSRPDWRFRASLPLAPDAEAERRRARQFGAPRPAPLGMRLGSVIVEDAAGTRYAAAREPTPIPGWHIDYLQPLAPLESAVFTRVRDLLLGAALLLALAIVLAMRVRERRAMQRESRRFLEHEVERRTADLRTANERLQVESRERELAAMRLREAREELAQANRLGSIGQITAGVAHEINQPIAAIRTFAENALRLIERDNVEKVRANLRNIVELTSRIGSITAELRRFARRGTPAIGAVQVQPAIRGALLLLGDRIRMMGADLRLDSGADAEVRVVADRVRLEQILINLVQNALDAMKEAAAPAIGIAVSVGERTVEIAVADNGPGVSPEIADKLFTPFVTSKRDGLGLGLGIARDIVREFGGELALAPSAAGARFVVTLRRA